jgi:serine/threonine protein kinase, bacterial
LPVDEVDGTPFGRYRLLELIGEGGMGEVWRAYDIAIDRTVAIKMLLPHFAQDEKFEQRFRREARAAARLDNPHVVPIHDVGEIDGRLYVAMRLIEGQDLQTLLEAGPLDPQRAAAIIGQVAEALHAAHKVGLVHRDVKPSNILVAEQDFVYLIDFGIARAAGETGLTSTGATIGTWSYMAPEMFSTGRAEASADIYALTCVLYECLTGQLPFPAVALQQIAVAHMTTPPPQPSTQRPTIPMAVDTVIATGMAKDPAQRYASTMELAAAAREAITVPLQRTTPSPVPDPTTEQMPSPVRAPTVTPHEPPQSPSAFTSAPSYHGRPYGGQPDPAIRAGAWVPGQSNARDNSPAPDWAAAPHQPQERLPRKGRPKWLIPLIAGLIVVVVIAVGAVTVFLVQDRSKPAAPVLGLAPQYLVNPIIPVGRGPNDVAVDPTTHALYVPNFNDNSVSVIDGRTYAVTTTIPGVPSPTQVAIAPTAHTLYITNSSTSGKPGTVTVIDTTRNTVTATIPVGINPRGVALDSDTHLVYVVNQNRDLNPPDDNYVYASQPGSVAVIDTTRNTVTATIPVGLGPQYVAIDSRTHRLYVTNQTDGTLSVIDTSARTTVATVRVGTSPKGVTVDADTNTVYVANFEAASISVIDATTNTVRTTVQTGNYPFAITVDAVRKLLYTANTPPLTDPTRPVSAAAIDTRTFASTVITGVGKIPGALALDIDSGALYVADYDGGKVYVVKPCYHCPVHPT